MIVPQSMLNFLKIFPKNHIWLRTGEAQKPLAQQLNPPALSYWPQLPLHATSKEFLYQNLGIGDEGKRESPQSFCILVSQTMLFLNLWWSPARKPRPIFFYLLFIIPMEKHIYCLVFFSDSLGWTAGILNILMSPLFYCVRKECLSCCLPW